MRDLDGLELGNIARSPAESVAPELFPDHAWVPALGFQGGMLKDIGRLQFDQVLDSTYTWKEKGLYKPANIYYSGYYDPNRFISSSISYTFFAWFNMTGTSFTPISYNIYNGDLMISLYSYFGTYRFQTSSGIASISSAIIGDHCLCGVQFPSNKKLYVKNQNGISIATNSSNGYCNGTTWYIGSYRQDSFSAAEGTIFCAYYLPKPIDDEAIFRLFSDPLLPLRRRKSVFYSFPLSSTPIHIFGRVS